MGYTQVALEDRILDMYPEIRQNGLSPRLSFDAGKNAWVVKLMKGKQEQTVYISKADADAFSPERSGSSNFKKRSITPNWK